MSRRSLGSNWNEISPEEQKDFTTVFSELLARTYLSKIETVKPGMVKVESEQVEGSKAVVKTVVISQGDTFPIDYKMMNRDNNWRVYDVVIENIGLVANYRNEFSGIIRKDKFSGLMEKLRAKVK
jgi:phospholipid transport system substrate-binding protein